MKILEFCRLAIETELMLTLSGLHDKRKARVDAIGGLLVLLGRCHRCDLRFWIES